MTTQPALKQAAEKALLALHMNRAAVDETLRREAETGLRLALGLQGQNVGLFDTLHSLCVSLDRLEARLASEGPLPEEALQDLRSDAENAQATMGYLLAHVEQLGGITNAEAEHLLNTAMQE